MEESYRFKGPMRSKGLFFGICLMLALSSNGSVLPYNYASNGLGSNWALAFQDNFSGTSLNTTNWVPYWFSNGTTNPGSGTRGWASNVVVNGQLNLIMRNTTNGALISSNPHGGAHPGFQFTYGYAEAQMTLPTNSGVISHWPAWWLDGQSWPTDGEIDIMEGLSGSAAWHYHYDKGGGTAAAIGANVNSSPGTHTYGVNWYPGHLDFYYDGVLVASPSNASLSGGATISSSPMYLILDCDGGSGPTPQTVVVHYVRVFQTTPPLSAQPTNGAVVLNWNAPPGYILQTNARLTNPAGWADMPGATNSPATTIIRSNSLFFRLRHE